MIIFFCFVALPVIEHLWYHCSSIWPILTPSQGILWHTRSWLRKASPVEKRSDSIMLTYNMFQTWCLMQNDVKLSIILAFQPWNWIVVAWTWFARYILRTNSVARLSSTVASSTARRPLGPARPLRTGAAANSWKVSVRDSMRIQTLQ